MRRLIGSLALLLLPSIAFGADVELSAEWTAPVMREDGTPITVEDISGYHVYYEVDGIVTEENSNSSFVTGTSTIITLDLAYRVEPYNFQMFVIAQDKFGSRSFPSNTVSLSDTVLPASNIGPPIIINLKLICLSECRLLGQ